MDLEGRCRKGIRRYSKLAIALALTAASFGIYSFIQRQAAKPTYSYVQPTVYFRDGTSIKSKKVQDYIAELEKVPDQLQEIVNSQDGKVIFFNGPLSNQPEFKNSKGPDQPWKKIKNVFDVTNAAFDQKTRSIFLGVEGKYHNQKPDDALDEVAHLIDFYAGAELFGMPLSETAEFLNIYEKDKPNLSDYEKVGLKCIAMKEYFANTFRMFYQSEESRRKLEKEFPERYKWFEDVERRIIRKQFSLIRGF